jgi:hypothetical protein
VKDGIPKNQGKLVSRQTGTGVQQKSLVSNRLVSTNEIENSAKSFKEKDEETGINKNIHRPYSPHLPHSCLDYLLIGQRKTLANNDNHNQT